MKEKYIVNWFHRYLLFCRRKNGALNKALTLIELLITIAIIGILSAIAVPMWTDYITDSRNAVAKADIANISSQLDRVIALTGSPPNDLTGITPTTDPWGQPYKYLKLAGVFPLPPGTRRDKSTVPINSDYDLYSMGPDGKTEGPLTGAKAWDDIVRASDGAFIDLGSEY